MRIGFLSPQPQSALSRLPSHFLSPIFFFSHPYNLAKSIKLPEIALHKNWLRFVQKRSKLNYISVINFNR